MEPRWLAAEALIEAFGPPTNETAKVMRWSFGAEFGFVLQKDGAAETARLWLPWPLRSIRNVSRQRAEVFDANRGRHSNTYAIPCLSKGKEALCMSLETHEHVVAAVDLVSKELAKLKEATD